ncbi:hypothetical protein [Amycolatopsis sp. NPDC049868]|uniref:hypothetical protein n=1 Tax=Amycolatopsis sp. NPDC049868 TaxID=3363934 RepID=UPI003793E914
MANVRLNDEEQSRSLSAHTLAIAIVAGVLACLTAVSTGVTTWLSIRDSTDPALTFMASLLAAMASGLASFLLAALAMKQLLR